MKKLLTFALALCMTLSLAACGDTKVVLETQTVNGISIDVPGDFSEFTEQAGGMMATDENKTGVITVSAPADAGGISPADFDQDAFVEQMLGAPEGIEITSFDNTGDCNGIPAIIAGYKLENSSGINVLTNVYILFHEDGTLQTVGVNRNDGEKSSTEENIDAIIKSVKKAE